MHLLLNDLVVKRKLVVLLLVLFLVVSHLMYSQGFDKSKVLISNQPSEQTKEILMENQSSSFEENLGQMTDYTGKPVTSVFYKVSTPTMQVFITQKGITYFFLKYNEDQYEEERERRSGSKSSMSEKQEVNYCRVDMELKNASIQKCNVISEFPSAGFSSYYYPHCTDGIKDVRKFKKVTIKEVYPGINWVICFNEKNELKYDFIVSPGADYKKIQIDYLSEKKLKLYENGNLVISSGLGSLEEKAPVSYLLNTDKEINSHFVKTNENRKYGGYETLLKFELQSYDKSKTLVIDPQVLWFTDFSTLGGYVGMGDITVNKVSGDVLITGYTSNLGMPLFDPSGGA
jgi:hypothetical protein